jgi:hypothetical protein
MEEPPDVPEITNQQISDAVALLAAAKKQKEKESTM